MIRRMVPEHFRPSLDLLHRRPGWFARRYWLPILVLLAGALLDVATTIPNVARFGPAVEAHPAYRYAMCALGPVPGTVVGKALQVVFVVLVAAVWKPWCPWIMAMAGLCYSAGALSNHLHWL